MVGPGSVATASCPPPPGLGLPEVPVGMYGEPAGDMAQIYVEQQPDAAEGVPETLAKANEDLLLENARLQWENAWLQSQQYLMASSMGLEGGEWPSSVMNPMAHWASGMRLPAHPGAIVAFSGLKNATELNGITGVVDRWDEESERWVVKLQSGEEKFAREQNLVVAEVPDCFWPYSTWDPAAAEAASAAAAAALAAISPTAPVATVESPSRPQGAGRAAAETAGSSSRKVKTSKVATPTAQKPHPSDLPRAKTPASFGSEISTSAGTSRSRTSSDGESDGSTKERTTVMMRNIPNNYTRDMLLELFDAEGFEKQYDLVYLPIDFQTEVGLGYAFINLVDGKTAETFRVHFHGFSGWHVVSQKVCEVSWSDALQGVNEHIERYRNSPVMHETVPDEFKPMLFEGGNRIAFPEPTKRIRAPRLRRAGAK